jgi:ADP-heptose:LPS heptosyltransferase
LNLKQKQFLDRYIGFPLIYLNILLARFLGFLLRRNHGIQNHPKEICIIKLLGFGSVIMASDAIYSLKLKYPEARLSIICSKGIEQGIRSIHLFEKIYVIDDSNFFRLLGSSIGTIFKLMVKRKLWVADLEVYSKLTGTLSLWTRAINRFGFYFNQVPIRYNLYTHNVYFNTVINVEDNYEELVRAMGVTDFQSYTIKGFPPRQPGKHYSFIAINNTCSELAQERKLTNGQLYEICEWINTNTSYRIALLGAPSDMAANDKFISDYKLDKDAVVNCAGKYEFEEYYRFLYDECAIMITIDSAPLHIANKLNIPNISIWGPTSPQSRINLDSGNEFIYLAVKCSPCAHFVDKLPCGGDNFCIKNMTTDLISQKIKTLLSA